MYIKIVYRKWKESIFHTNMRNDKNNKLVKRRKIN